MSKKHWYKCRYMVSPLGAAWCTKNDDWCKKRQCQDRMSKIADMFINILTPHCKECGAKLSLYPFYSEEYELYFCDKCGAENRKKRVDV